MRASGARGRGLIASPLAALLAAAGLSSPPASAEAPFAFATAPGRLPKDVRPTAYRIDLSPDIAGLKFSGHEEVDLEVAAPTERLVLDADELRIAKAWLAGEDAATASVAVDEKARLVTFTFGHPIAAGRHTLVVDYGGPIPETPAGLYYNDYDAGGRRERLLVTQFEATDARHMFPGWDEPAFKATFRLSVVIPDELAAVSNMPVAGEAPAGADATGRKLKRVSFAETPPMSSYLLALAIGRLEAIRGTAGKTTIGVWAQAGKANQGDFALAEAIRILPYYEEYFGVPYPLPKLDLIAVPGNFSAGAMENWGAITFIDNDLLFDPATSGPETREDIFGDLAHEMAHLWSGDLVTLGWWDNVWLNEGFANWMQYNATERFHPDWQVWLRARAAKEVAMATDAGRGTRALQLEIADESAADDEFDEISYDKGAAVIRMIETWLGPDRFRDGMRRYMAAHAYSNATPADLWAALSAASGEDVAAVAGGFTEQPGVPLVHASARCRSGKTEVKLDQERFTVEYADAARESWRIPVRVALAGGAAQSVLLAAGGATAELPGCGPVVANAGDAGYYRVAYDAAGLKALTASFPKLAAADRAMLLGDQWALATAGKADLAGWLDLTRQLRGEAELAVWQSVLAALRRLDALERGAPDREAFRAYAASLLRPALGRLGWEAKPGEAEQAPLLRAALIETLGRYGDGQVVAEAGRRFSAFLADPKSLPAPIAASVLRTVGATADKPTYEKLRALGRAAGGSEGRLRYYDALAAARDPALIDETVAIGLTDEVAPGRINRVLTEAAEESDDPARVWRDLVSTDRAVLERLPDDERARLLAAVAAATDDPKIAAQLEARPEAAASEGARERFARGAEAIAADVAFRTRALPVLAAWLHRPARGEASASSRGRRKASSSPSP